MGDSSSEDVVAGKSLRSLRLRPKQQSKNEQSPASSLHNTTSPNTGAAAASKRSSRSRDPEFAAKQKAFLAKVVTATNGSMDSFLANQQISNMDISDNQADVGVTPSLDQQPTSGLLKRKLSTLKSAASDANNAGNDEATSNKRRKSSRTSNSGTACVSCKNCKIDEESEIDDDVVEPEIDDKTEIVVPPKNWRHFDSKQKRILMEAFEKNPWPNIETKKALSKKIGIKVKGVSSWFERTRFKRCIKRTMTETTQTSTAKPEKPSGFPPFPQPTPRPNKEFLGVDLRLLESIYHEEQNPDTDWLLKIAQFTERNVEDVAKWFKTRNLKRPCDIGYWNIL